MGGQIKTLRELCFPDSVPTPVSTGPFEAIKHYGSALSHSCVSCPVVLTARSKKLNAAIWASNFMNSCLGDDGEVMKTGLAANIQRAAATNTMDRWFLNPGPEHDALFLFQVAKAHEARRNC